MVRFNSAVGMQPTQSGHAVLEPSGAGAKLDKECKEIAQSFTPLIGKVEAFIKLHGNKCEGEMRCRAELSNLGEFSGKLKGAGADSYVAKNLDVLREGPKALGTICAALEDESIPMDTRVGWALETGHALNGCADSVVTNLNDVVRTVLHTALHGAVKKHQVDVVKQLCVAGAPLEEVAPGGRNTALIGAVESTSAHNREASVEIVKLLCEAGANLDAKNANGFTPLELAKERAGRVGNGAGDQEVVDILKRTAKARASEAGESRSGARDFIHRLFNRT